LNTVGTVSWLHTLETVSAESETAETVPVLHTLAAEAVSFADTEDCLSPAPKLH